MSTRRFIIGLTLGDPAGIGPELVAAAVKKYSRARNFELRLIGSAQGVRPGKLSKTSARIALGALKESYRLLKSGEISAVVNAPVHKGNLSTVGFHFPGQTEFYADCAGLKPDDVTMMMTSKKFSVSLVTTHCALARVPKLLTPAAILTTIRRTAEALKGMGIAKPRIAVCGLNPHAGEGGLFGSEEKIISASIHQASKKLGRAVTLTGPWPPDTVFIAARDGKHDAVVSMYHDQGLIPFKLLAFDSGVNLTLGLPFLRAAPDHGTALDIAGKGVASPASFFTAIELVAGLLQRGKNAVG